MPTIQEPNVDESFDGEDTNEGENIETSAHDKTSTGGRKGAFGGVSRGRGARRTDHSATFTKHSLMTKVREL